jgi:hypothetical protein
MNSLKSCNELVRELGDISMRLCTLESACRKFPFCAGCLSEDEVNCLIEPLKNNRYTDIAHEITKRLPEFRELSRVERFSESSIDEYARLVADNNLSIAGRIFGHDLRNVWNYLGLLPPLFEGLSSEEKKENLGSLIANSLHARLFGSAVAYLGSNGRETRFLDEVDIGRLEYLIKTTQNRLVEVDVDSMPLERTVRNDWYVCLNEFVCNSLSYKLDGHTPKVCVNVFRDYAKSGQEYQVIEVLDSGTGVLLPDGSDMPADRLGSLYGDYSIKGKGSGGLGGQVVAALVALENQFRKKEKVNVALITKSTRGIYRYFHLAEKIFSSEKEILQVKLPDYYLSPRLPHFEHGTRVCLEIPVP